ncbi:PAS domain S-box protein [bacterium]
MNKQKNVLLDERAGKKADNSKNNLPINQLQLKKRKLPSAINKFGASNQNQQLRALIQQLKAENQQLNANNQQLRAIEQKLSEKEERLRAFMDSATDGFFLWDSKFNLADVNKAGLSLFPAVSNKQEIIGKNILELVPNLKKTNRYSKYLDVIKTGNPFFINDIVPNSKFGNIHLSIKAFKVNRVMGQILTNITEQKKTEQALKEAELKWRSLVKSVPSIIMIVALDGTMEFINHAVPGHSIKQTIGKKIYDFIPQQYHETVKKTYDYVFETGKIGRYETIADIPGVGSFYFESFLGPIKHNGKIVAFIVNSADITKRRKVEEKLKKAYHAIENSSNAIFTADMECNLIYVNPSASKMWGFKNTDEMVGTSCFDHWAVSSIGDINNIIGILAKEGYYNNEKGLTAKRKDGTEFLVSIKASIIKDNSGEPVGMTASFNDITTIVETTNKLKDSEEKYRTLIEGSTDGIIIADIETMKFVYANQAVCNMLGYTKHELVNMGIMDIHPKDKLEYVISEFKKQKKSKELLAKDIPCLKKDNTVFYADVSTTPSIINGRNVYVGFFRDITVRKNTEKERVKLQSQLVQSQKMEAIGTLAGGVAHDFNNLLTIIMGNANMIMTESAKGSARYENLDEISSAAARAASLTRQLLLFSRKQPLGFILLNINNIINNLISMLNRLIGEDIKININLEPNLWDTKVDEANIEQVITNLTVNARDAMPKGGTLTIKTENVTLDEDQCRINVAAYPGKFVCILVEDTGLGMHKETIQHIFEPFFSTKGLGKGTGLGLPVIYGIIKQHNGWINIYSEPGHGSIFRVYIPASSVKVKEQPKKNNISVKKLKGHGERVLLVEDEEAICRYAEKVLTNNNYNVFVAENTEKALDIFKKEQGNFDLIISDMILPDNTGLNLIEKILLLKPDINVMFCSGYLDDKSQWTEVRDKGYNFLQKPFEMNTFIATVRESLDNH